MRLAEPATVSKFERLKPPYVGVTVDSSDFPFFAFFQLTHSPYNNSFCCSLAQSPLLQHSPLFHNPPFCCARLPNNRLNTTLTLSFIYAQHLGMAATIAIRYSAVRLQGWKESSSTPTPTPTPTQKPVENQILDYTTQQHRLFGVLACSYCFHFTGRLTLARLKQYERALLSGKGNITKPEIQDLHASSSALKAFCSTVAADGIEDCR